ncbi:hypothetical protein THAOC_30326 [Thalassiosira oceanica]|uniref:phosphatidyl-N-methylethanolamine N-methyltransferase n=1 Tax=Thalassiosira oceanica TaxID=159749 RepID=K0REI5_THAOC|nr:hypothetical protein THAOC_30326 [Thalassiosira oceanica]|eukprot:EJK50634.1 hypothetical protein THAOC_30326 [Thalassiosira oceanica]
MITTPMGVVASLVALRQATVTFEYVYEVILILYLMSLFVTLGNFRLWLATTAWMAGLAAVAERLVPTFTDSDCAKLLAAGFLGQELAHLITGEKTFQSTYQFKTLSWPVMLLEHTYFLLPLCIDALIHMPESFASWIVAHNFVVRCKLTDANDKKAMKTIVDFVTEEDPARDCTAHWWYQKLNSDVRDAFTHVMECPEILGMFQKRFRSDAYAIETIPAMNEIYVSSSHHDNNSDTVFYTQHCDGPWSVYPFCHVYRVMLAVNENVQVETHFTMEGGGGCLSDGDAVGFDYNREIHVISDLPTKNKDRRITCKMHYVVYPRCFGRFGKLLGILTTWYNTNARNLFLATIKPRGLIWKFMAWVVVFTTKRVRELEKYAGLNNVMTTVALYVLGQYIHPRFFMCATSFTHYCMYIATYHVRTGINFGVFKRNVVYFKAIALTHLCVNYIANFTYDPVSIAMILMGYGLSTSAVMALGIDQTYFGVELGVMEPNFVSGFPYNVVPHPMIVGSMIGLLGLHKMDTFRTALPYLVPMHCFMYFTHMVQEQAQDIYRNAEERKANSVKRSNREKAKAA